MASNIINQCIRFPSVPLSLWELENNVGHALNEFFEAFHHQPLQNSEIFSRWIQILPLTPENPPNASIEKVARAIKTIITHDLPTLLKSDMDKRDITCKLMFSKSTCRLLCMRSEYSESLANVFVAFDKAGLEVRGANWCWFLANPECAASLADLMARLNQGGIEKKKKEETVDILTTIFSKWKQIEVLSRREHTELLLRKVDPVAAAREDEEFARLSTKDFAGMIKIEPQTQQCLIDGWWVAAKIGLLPSPKNSSLLVSNPKEALNLFNHLKVLSDSGFSDEIIKKTSMTLVKISSRIPNLDPQIKESWIKELAHLHFVGVLPDPDNLASILSDPTRILFLENTTPFLTKGTFKMIMCALPYLQQLQAHDHLAWLINSPQLGMQFVEILVLLDGVVDITQEVLDIIRAIKNLQSFSSALTEAKQKNRLTKQFALESLEIAQSLNQNNLFKKRHLELPQEKSARLRVAEP